MTTGGWGQPGGSPWADPSTPTEPGAPYAGPPPTAPPYGAPPPAYGYPPPYAAAPWGVPYGYPVPPRRPQRPGQVITAAVLAFAQSVVVLIASVYVWFFASVADVATTAADGVYDPATVDALATEGTVLAIVQLVSVVLLIGAGVWVLNSRRRAAATLLVVALAVQVVLAAYWMVRLQSEIGGYDTDGTIVAFSLFFAAAPLVGLGMLLIGPGRRWFDGTPQP
ncbi:DUF6264 family protein [Blastococcus sp. SYSU D00922]